jgi:predicted HTH transcriptional regulator
MENETKAMEARANGVFELVNKDGFLYLEVVRHRKIPSGTRYYLSYNAESKEMEIAKPKTREMQRHQAKDLISEKATVTHGEFVRLSMDVGMSKDAAKRYHAKLVREGQLKKVGKRQYKLVDQQRR